jgi:hypothetical protein
MVELRRKAPGYTRGFVCDACDDSISTSWGIVMHCDACDYDLCAPCAWRAIPAHLKPAVAATGLTPTCERGHVLAATTIAELGTRRSEYITGYKCNLCR